jgi:hypothetical protein
VLVFLTGKREVKCSVLRLHVRRLMRVRVCVQVDVCVRKLNALLNSAPSKPKLTAAAPPSAPGSAAFGAGEGVDEWEGGEGGVGGGGCVAEDEDSSDGGEEGGADDYELNDTWGGGGEEEEVTVVLGGAEGQQLAVEEEAKPEEAAST